jgi:hypothetical protein
MATLSRTFYRYLFLSFLTGCAGKPIIETQVVEKPMPVYCTVAVPSECKEAYAVDRVSPADDPFTINRAFRIELEERSACEIKLKAAIRGCNTVQTAN